MARRPAAAAQAPEPTEPTEPPEPDRLRSRLVLMGIIIAAIGGFAVAASMTATWIGATRQPVVCESLPFPTSGDAFVYAPKRDLWPNYRLCVAWKPSAYFKDELETKDMRSEVLKEAEREEAAARGTVATLLASGTATKEELAERATRREAAERRRRDLATALPDTPDQVSITVFLDDEATPVSFAGRVEDAGWRWETLTLRAPNDASSEEARVWRNLLSENLSSSRQVKISLGDTGAVLPRKGADVDGARTLNIYQPVLLWSGILGLWAMMAGLVIAGWRTILLRDRSPIDLADRPPFSLARCQMAWWTLITLAGFLFVWMVSGQYIGVMTTAIVALVGVSGASTAAAAAVDATTDPELDHPDLPMSKGLIRDILSDGTGEVVLHRVQMLAWTLVLGIIFLWTVATTYAFPVFDDALILLAGVVGGVYVGLKIPEKTTVR